MLSDDQVSTALADLPGWARSGDALERTFERKGGFSGAVAWVSLLAEVADAADHHPDISIAWNRVTVRWTSHSAGGITERDIEMAAKTDALA